MFQIYAVFLTLFLLATPALSLPVCQMRTSGNSVQVDKLLGEGVVLLNSKKYLEAINDFDRLLAEPHLQISTFKSAHAERASAYLGLQQHTKALEDFVYSVDTSDEWSVKNFHFYCSNISDNQSLFDIASAILTKADFEQLRVLFAKEFFERKDMIDCLVLLSEAKQTTTQAKDLRIQALNNISKTEISTLQELADKHSSSPHASTWKALQSELDKL